MFKGDPVRLRKDLARARMQDAGLTTRAIAERTGLNVGYVVEVIGGRMRTSRTTGAAIARMLGVSTKELFAPDPDCAKSDGAVKPTP